MRKEDLLHDLDIMLDTKNKANIIDLSVKPKPKKAVTIDEFKETISAPVPPVQRELTMQERLMLQAQRIQTERTERVNTEPTPNTEPTTNLNELFAETVESNSRQSISGKRFVFTGTLSRVRSHYTKIVEDNGGRVVNQVNGQTDYLVIGSGGEGSTKHTSAVNLGKPIITEQEFIDMFLS